MKVKKKVLVYDNQLGYYKMLVENLGNEISFILYETMLPKLSFDAVTFFMGDELEAHDMKLLLEMKKPFILGTFKKAGINDNKQDNVYLVDLKRTKDVLLNKLKEIFTTLHIWNNKTKAPGV